MMADRTPTITPTGTIDTHKQKGKKIKLISNLRIKIIIIQETVHSIENSEFPFTRKEIYSILHIHFISNPLGCSLSDMSFDFEILF
jgi:septum formation topological specificity factor MinE